MISQGTSTPDSYQQAFDDFKFEVNHFKLPHNIHLGMIDTNDGSDTVLMVKQVLAWSGEDFD